jgi:hypothetical protein
MVVASATWAPGDSRTTRRPVKAYCHLRVKRGPHLRSDPVATLREVRR